MMEAPQGDDLQLARLPDGSNEIRSVKRCWTDAGLGSARNSLPCLLGLTIWLLVASTLLSAEADQALIAVMRHSSPDVFHIQPLQRVLVNQELDLAIVLGYPRKWPSPPGDHGWWGSETTLGLLLQRRDRPALVYKLLVERGQGSPGEANCNVRVERATATEVVLSCTPEQGAQRPNLKFVYDLRSKSLIKRIAYEPFGLQRLFVVGETAILVGSNHQRLVTVKYNPSDIPSFHLLKGSEAQQWTQRVRVNVGSEGSGAELRRRIYLDPKPFKPVSFGPEDHFTLVQENKTIYEPQQKRLLVIEQIGKTVKRYRLPRTTYDEFARARPASVKGGLTRQVTTIDEEIGAWQIADRVPWFGKSFYDGEGNTGVGGFGYFDIKQRKYRMYSPPEIVDWSVSAMLVQPNNVWLALAHRGEYGDSGGGLLQFNRATQTVEWLALPDIATDIASVGDHVLLATDSGAAVVEGKKLRRFFVDEATNGQLQVVEAKPGVDVP